MSGRTKLISILTNLSGRFFEISSVKNNGIFALAYAQNPWFSPEFIKHSIQAIAGAISKEKLQLFCDQYHRPLSDTPKSIGLIMAGNIPLSGFFDLVMVLLSGHTAVIQLSSSDQVLTRFAINELVTGCPELGNSLIISENLKKVDAIIATGSDNSAMYFNYYFRHIPRIIRKNRCSVAVIKSENTIYPEKSSGLADDILLYFGLGCRSISSLYFIGIGSEQKFTDFIYKLTEPYRYLSHHHKYANNYLYRKTLLSMNNRKHYDNGFLLLVQEKKICSPVSVCHYEFFENEEDALNHIAENKNFIQCVVSESGHFPGSIPFGKAQQPELWDFADGVNVMEFLGRL